MVPIRLPLARHGSVPYRLQRPFFYCSPWKWLNRLPEPRREPVSDCLSEMVVVQSRSSEPAVDGIHIRASASFHSHLGDLVKSVIIFRGGWATNEGNRRARQTLFA